MCAELAKKEQRAQEGQENPQPAQAGDRLFVHPAVILGSIDCAEAACQLLDKGRQQIGEEARQRKCADNFADELNFCHSVPP